MSLFGFLFQKEKEKVENVDFLVDAFKPIHKDVGDVKMFQFHIGSFDESSGSMPEFKQLIKNPAPEPISKSEPVKMQQYKVESFNPIKVERAFGDIVVNNGDIEAPKFPNPQYYQYNLDKYSLTDIAMKRLDVEMGETNDIARQFQTSKEDFMKMMLSDKELEFTDDPDQMNELVSNISKGKNKPFDSQGINTINSILTKHGKPRIHEGALMGPVAEKLKKIHKK